MGLYNQLPRSKVIIKRGAKGDSIKDIKIVHVKDDCVQFEAIMLSGHVIKTRELNLPKPVSPTGLDGKDGVSIEKVTGSIDDNGALSLQIQKSDKTIDEVKTGKLTRLFKVASPPVISKITTIQNEDTVIFDFFMSNNEHIVTEPIKIKQSQGKPGITNLIPTFYGVSFNYPIKQDLKQIIRFDRRYSSSLSDEITLHEDQMHLKLAKSGYYLLDVDLNLAISTNTKIEYLYLNIMVDNSIYQQKPIIMPIIEEKFIHPGYNFGRFRFNNIFFNGGDELYFSVTTYESGQDYGGTSISFGITENTCVTITCLKVATKVLKE